GLPGARERGWRGGKRAAADGREAGGGEDDPEPFFLQAEDRIRAPDVTGVQTCALPICPGDSVLPDRQGRGDARGVPRGAHRQDRSEERRVGKEWRARRGPEGRIRNEKAPDTREGGRENHSVDRATRRARPAPPVAPIAA